MYMYFNSYIAFYMLQGGELGGGNQSPLCVRQRSVEQPHRTAVGAGAEYIPLPTSPRAHTTSEAAV